MRSLTIKKEYGSVGFAPSSSLGVMLQKHHKNEGGQPPHFAVERFFLCPRYGHSPMAGVAWLYNSFRVKAKPASTFVDVFERPATNEFQNFLGGFSKPTKETVMSKHPSRNALSQRTATITPLHIPTYQKRKRTLLARKCEVIPLSTALTPLQEKMLALFMKLKRKDTDKFICRAEALKMLLDFDASMREGLSK